MTPFLPFLRSEEKQKGDASSAARRRGFIHPNQQRTNKNAHIHPSKPPSIPPWTSRGRNEESPSGIKREE